MTMTLIELVVVMVAIANLVVGAVAAIALWRLQPILDLISRTLLTIQLEYSEVKRRLDDVFETLLAFPPTPLLRPPRARERGADDTNHQS